MNLNISPGVAFPVLPKASSESCQSDLPDLPSEALYVREGVPALRSYRSELLKSVNQQVVSSAAWPRVDVISLRHDRSSHVFEQRCVCIEVSGLRLQQ